MFFEREILSIYFVIILFTVVPIAMLGLGLPYVVARIRERSGQPDPHIGIKTAHHFFMTCGIFLMLLGFTFICVRLMELDNDDRFGGGGGPFGPGPRFGPGPGFGFGEHPLVRTAFAFLIVGGLFTLLHGLMLLATNDGRMRNVRRAFTGFRFAVSGLLVLVTVTIILTAALQYLPPGVAVSRFAMIKPFLGILIVWVPCWFIHMIFLLIGTPRATPAPSDYPPMEREREPERFYND